MTKQRFKVKKYNKSVIGDVRICKMCSKKLIVIEKMTAQSKYYHQECNRLYNKNYLKKYPGLTSFLSAKGRCNNLTNPNYYRYGGRGIKFKFKTFKDFITHIGPRPSMKHSLDRINTNGHYEIGNVRWATPNQQGRNRRGVKLTYEIAQKIRLLKGLRPKDIMKKLSINVHPSVIHQIIKGRRWALPDLSLSSNP